MPETDQECVPVYEPELEIVDAHHHLSDHAGSSYLLDDLLADTSSGHCVTQTVYIECGWHWNRHAPPALVPLPETSAVKELAAESRTRGGAVISGIVAHTDLRLGRDAIVRSLDAHAAAAQGILVGIRHATAWDLSPDVPRHRTHPEPGLMRTDIFRAGLAELARRDLVFDAWVYHPQLNELAEAAAKVPDLRIVVDHLGAPLSVGPYARQVADVDHQWRRSLRELARQDNVALKLGGIGQALMMAPEHRRSPPSADDLADAWRERIRWCIEIFGPYRCMFESNFPVDRITCSYRTLWNAFKLIVSDLSSAEKDALFHQTARDVYAMSPAESDADGRSPNWRGKSGRIMGCAFRARS